MIPRKTNYIIVIKASLQSNPKKIKVILQQNVQFCLYLQIIVLTLTKVIARLSFLLNLELCFYGCYHPYFITKGCIPI